MSPERQRPYSPGVTEAVAADSPLFQGAGSMTYPEANMERMRDGIGMAGPGAYCIVTRGEIRIGPTEFFKRLQKPMPVRWPDLVLPVNEVRCVEQLFLGRYRFRLDSVELDGACFQPSEGKRQFLAALEGVGIPIKRLARSTKLRAELRMMWNQTRPRPLRN
jgi:hypothetical protein